MNNSIELNIDGPRITPDKFLKASDAFLHLLLGVAHNIDQKATSDDWIVQTEKGSNVLRALCQVSRQEAIVAVSCGLMSLSSGVQALPTSFTKDEVKQARILASVLDADGKNVSRLFVKSGDSTPLILGPEIVKTADAILSGEKHESFGSIEGHIETMIFREGHPLVCSIRDFVHHRLIQCSFTNVESEDAAYKAFRPPKRISVSGLIHCAPEGHAVRINADQVRVFPDESELPTLEEIHSFFSK
jgi:hypothetical protein